MDTKGINSIVEHFDGRNSNIRKTLEGKSVQEVVAALLTPLQSGNVDLGSVAEEVQTIIEKVYN